MILTNEGELVAQGLINAVNEMTEVGDHLLQLWFFSHDNARGFSSTVLRCSICGARGMFVVDDMLTGSYWEEFFRGARITGHSFGQALCKAGA